MSSNAVDRLRRFTTRATDHSTCDLCRSALTQRHRHLFEITQRQILCACDACALLFSDAPSSRIRPIPESVNRIELELSDAQWSGLGIPIGMAFFTVREQPVTWSTQGAEIKTADVAAAAVNAPPVTTAEIMVGYPSPAGLVMSSVEQQQWQSVITANPSLGRLRPEVESLLVNRTFEGRRAFITPLDVCFELIGIIRRHWSGWSGGAGVHREVDRFFAQLELSAGKQVLS